MARNLTPAMALGMVGVWIETKSTWGRPDPNDPLPSYKTNDLALFLDSHQDES